MIPILAAMWRPRNNPEASSFAFAPFDRALEAEPVHELELLAGSGYRIIALETSEPARASGICMELALRLQMPVFEWTCVTGLVPLGVGGLNENTIEPLAALASFHATTEPVVCVMRDIGTHLDNDRIVGMMGQIASSGRGHLVLIDSRIDMPDRLRASTAVYALPRPSQQHVAQHVSRRIDELCAGNAHRSELDDTGRARLAQALVGLTLEEIDRVVSRIAVEDKLFSDKDIDLAASLRADLLADDGVVTLVKPTESLDWLAGFPHLRTWIGLRHPVLDERARAYGLDPAKGVLLTGVPGCGKSCAVKALATSWQLPLLRLDAGALFSKFVGDSEQNLRRAFAVAEGMAPSVLWIDELEKGFSSVGASQTDGGLGFRLVGMLLTWMQERTQPVFLAATANNVDSLPPELMRQGRFDEIFFVDLPTPQERAHQFAIQLALRRRDYRGYDCAALADASEGFSGAEIEQAVVNGLYASYGAGVELSTHTLLEQIAATVPLSRSAPDRIDRIRAWGATHARPA